MKQGYFVTGTDTNIGKTYAALQLLNHFKQQGLSTAAIKPIATGCEITPQGLRNADALQLQQAATLQFPYQNINPFAFHPPIAPHLAAEQINQTLSVDQILTACNPVIKSNADIIIVEGIGGWKVPLNANETMADFAIQLGFPIIFVVGIRLGCLNHALLTWESLHNKNVKVAGWIANCPDANMLHAQDNIVNLSQHINSPLLATIAYQDKMILNQKIQHF